MNDTDTNQARTAAATAAASASRTARRLRRMAAELTAAGYAVTEPGSNTAIPAPDAASGAEELARELLSRLPVNYVLRMTGETVRGSEIAGRQFSWSHVLALAINDLMRTAAFPQED